LEEGANKRAADFLIPPADLSTIANLTELSKRDIVAFASNLDLAPGIVVGRLQPEGLVHHSHLNDLKHRLPWNSIIDGNPAA
jgi:hypothetical protein